MFEITIENETNIIKSVRPIVIKDTEYIGDKIQHEKYLNQFIGKDITTMEQVEKNDVVSGATFSVKSSMRALLEVQKALQ